jgi:hypothetical protein
MDQAGNLPTMSDLERSSTSRLHHNCSPEYAAAAAAILVFLLTGVGDVASYSQPLDTAHAFGVGLGAVSGSGAAEEQQQEQQQQQQGHVWEEGAVDSPDWCQGAAAVRASLAPMLQLQTYVNCKQQGNISSSSSSSGVTGAGVAHQLGAAVACDAWCAVPFATPALQLQQQWAVNLQCALALNTHQQHLPGPQPPGHANRQQSQKHQQPQQQQQQQRQASQGVHESQAAPGWLQKLLGANAAVPLEQLTQLDLSLEQLPGLHDLDVLCPQLTSMAVNMNGLSSLPGLEGCTGLLHLSAQVCMHHMMQV